jgi:hypothetical protein
LLGVQIEAEQYRLVAECNKNDENGRDCDALYHEMVDFGWFDDSYEKETKKIFNRPTKMEPRGDKKYNSYKNREDSMTFIYQYYDITNDNCDYDELFENTTEIDSQWIEFVKKLKCINVQDETQTEEKRWIDAQNKFRQRPLIPIKCRKNIDKEERDRWFYDDVVLGKRMLNGKERNL